MAAEVLLAAAAARGMLLNFTTLEDFRFLLTIGWSCLAIESSFQELEKLLQDVCNKGRSGRSELETDTTLDMVPEAAAAAAAAVMVKQKTSQPKTQKNRSHKNTHTEESQNFLLLLLQKKKKHLTSFSWGDSLGAWGSASVKKQLANTRNWASSLLLPAAWSSYNCCNQLLLLLLLLLLVGISEYSNYNTFQEATSFPHSLFCWKKKLQTQVLYRIGDEEHHQSSKKKFKKNSLTLCSETEKLCERKT
jgi:hypothetical protein